MVLAGLSEAAGEEETGEKDQAGPLSGDCSPFQRPLLRPVYPWFLSDGTSV